jgi:hypothetical protein
MTLKNLVLFLGVSAIAKYAFSASDVTLLIIFIMFVGYALESDMSNKLLKMEDRIDELENK